MNTLSVAGVPFFELGHIDLGIKLQWFGILVASGVLLGVHIARKYGDRFAIDDDDMRGMTMWVVVSGFIGAHVFDVLMYQQEALKKDPLLLVMLWKGISSYGGFIGGAIGWYSFHAWKRLSTGLWADLTVIGLMIGFTIGRVGCTVVHDHMGRMTDFFLGTDYPKREIAERGLLDSYPAIRGLGNDAIVRIHNLGMYELFYLIPVNALILWLAFRKKPLPAGLLAILLGLLYAPVRFFFEFLRLNETDPRYAGLTFAQWASLLAFAAAGWAFVHVLRHGKPATRAEDLAPKQIGGRRDGGPRLTAKDLKDLDRPTKPEIQKKSKKKGK
jgi:phosphatidylglycerol:prolipoprotein diacylglycerol transferase